MSLAEHVRLQVEVADCARSFHSAACNLDNEDPLVIARFGELTKAIEALDAYENPPAKVAVCELEDIDWKKVEELRAKITTFPNLSVMVYPSDEHPGWWRVKSTIQTRNSHTGKPNGYEVPCLFKHRGPPSRERLGRWVRKVVAWQLMHELDEGLCVDGVRVRDPHRKTKAKKKLTDRAIRRRVSENRAAGELGRKSK